jgi:hypothetical protein
MVEAFILFKLLNTSMLDMYKVFEHIDMISIDILSYSLKQFYPQHGGRDDSILSAIQEK